MGFFSFVRAAGRVLGVNVPDLTQDESKPAPPAPTAEAIQAELNKLGLPVEGLEVKVDGDTVTLKGSTTDAAVREKAIIAAGNIAGIAKVDDGLAAPAGTAEPVFHTVVKGDTLSAIAKKHYGNASAYPKIFEANKPMLSNPDKIYPGQVLRIPQ